MKKYCSEIYIENFSGSIAGIERPAPMNLQKENNIKDEDVQSSRYYTKKELMAKLASLNSTLGRIKEASRFEQMMKRPIEKPRNLDDDGREVRRISMADLGIDLV